MAIEITAQVATSVTTYTIDVGLTSVTQITDPAGFVEDDPGVQVDILARAGLSSTLNFLSAELGNSGFVGVQRFYRLTVKFDTT